MRKKGCFCIENDLDYIIYLPISIYQRAIMPSVNFVFFYIRNTVGGIKMLSKNNKRLQAEKMEPKHQRFAIKKFTVGVASVLIWDDICDQYGNKSRFG